MQSAKLIIFIKISYMYTIRPNKMPKRGPEAKLNTEEPSEICVMMGSSVFKIRPTIIAIGLLKGAL